MVPETTLDVPSGHFQEDGGNGVPELSQGHIGECLDHELTAYSEFLSLDLTCTTREVVSALTHSHTSNKAQTPT